MGYKPVTNHESLIFPMAHLSRMGSKGRLAEWLKWLVNDGYVNNDGWLMRNCS